MDDRRDLVNELRRQFLDGATPSALLQVIRQEMGERVSHLEACDVFNEAFQLPVVRFGPAVVSNTTELHGRMLNKTLLMEIVQLSPEWNENESTSWFEGAEVTDPSELKRRVAAQPFPGISEGSWLGLRPEERESLLVQFASSQVISQRLEVLARLAERLQQKVTELEAASFAVVERGVVESPDNRDVVCTVHYD